jgi:GNAT superfamily N-acetyltransferase
MLASARSHLDKGWFDIVLNQPEDVTLDYLRGLALTPAPSWWRYSRFHIAEVDGVAASAIAAFRAGDAYPLSQQAMLEAAASVGMTEAAVGEMWQRGSYIFTCTLDTSDDVWAIENVATLPGFRRRGLAGALLQHALENGRRAGSAQAQITFLIGNDAAERAYAKAGFLFDGERRHPAFEAATGSPGLRRYTLDLSPGHVPAAPPEGSGNRALA